jgi:hypothetical protein
MIEDERDVFDEIDRGRGPAALVRTRVTRARQRRALGEEGWEGIKPEASRTPRPASLRRASRPDQPHGIHQRSADRAGPRSPHVQFRTPLGRFPLRLQQRLNLTRGAERTRERRIAEVILVPPFSIARRRRERGHFARGAHLLLVRRPDAGTNRYVFPRDISEQFANLRPADIHLNAAQKSHLRCPTFHPNDNILARLRIACIIIFCSERLFLSKLSWNSRHIRLLE